MLRKQIDLGAIAIVLFLFSISWLWVIEPKLESTSLTLVREASIIMLIIGPGVISGWYVFSYAKKRWELTDAIRTRVLLVSLLLALLPYLPFALPLALADQTAVDTAPAVVMLMMGAFMTSAAAVIFGSGLGQSSR